MVNGAGSAPRRSGWGRDVNRKRMVARARAFADDVQNATRTSQIAKERFADAVACTDAARAHDQVLGSDLMAVSAELFAKPIEKWFEVSFVSDRQRVQSVRNDNLYIILASVLSPQFKEN